MMWDLKKFKNEISMLKELRHDSGLHPLRKEQIRQAILEDIQKPTAQSSAEPFDFGYLQQTSGHFWRYIFASVLGFALVGGSAFASQSSLPGDIFYPVKIAGEHIVLNLTFSSESKAKLQSKYAEKRLDELTKLRKKTNVDLSVQVATTSTDTDKQNESEAKNNLQNAIQTLTDVKTKLEAKGNTQAASSVGETLLRLQGKHEGGVEVEITMPKTSTSTSATSTSSSHAEVHIKIEDNGKVFEENRNEDNVKGVNIEVKTNGSSSSKVEIKSQINSNNSSHTETTTDSSN